MKTPLRLYVAYRIGPYGDRKPDPARCPVTVADNTTRVTHWHQCSRKPKPGCVRPVETDDRVEDAPLYERVVVDMNVCGVHGGIYDRALKKATVESREQQVRDDEMSQMKDIASAIVAAGHGLAPEVDTTAPFNKSWQRRPTGRVIVDGAALLELVQKFNEYEEALQDVVAALEPVAETDEDFAFVDKIKEVLS